MNPKAIQFPGAMKDERGEEEEPEEQDLSVVPVEKSIRTEETDYMTALDSIVSRGGIYDSGPKRLTSPLFN